MTQDRTTTNKMMQTVLEEVGEVVYYIDTWFIAFGVRSEFCLMLMQDSFLPKTSFFQSQFVYLASYLCSKTLKTLNDFFFCHLFLKGGMVILSCQNVHAHSNNIQYNITMVNNEYNYILLPVHKAQKRFLTTSSSPHFTCYTLPPLQQIGPGCSALAGGHFKMTPHFKKLYCINTPSLPLGAKEQ